MDGRRIVLSKLVVNSVGCHYERTLRAWISSVSLTPTSRSIVVNASFISALYLEIAALCFVNEASNRGEISCSLSSVEEVCRAAASVRA